MHALEIAISAKITGRPPSRTRCDGFVDERFRDRCENEHGRANDTGIHGRPRRAPAAGSVTVPALMRVWIDLTNSPHVLVMRPVVERLAADGHEVRVTARDFAQTLELVRPPRG